MHCRATLGVRRVKTRQAYARELFQTAALHLARARVRALEGAVNISLPVAVAMSEAIAATAPCLQQVLIAVHVRQGTSYV